MQLSDEEIKRLARIAEREERDIIDEQRHGYAHYSSEIGEAGWEDIVRAVLRNVPPEK